MLKDLIPKAALKAKGISVFYEKKAILKTIDFSLFENELTIIIGPNGCGKSTLLKSLARLVPIKTGKISLFDQDLYHVPSKWVAKQIALLPQALTVTENIRVYDLVAYGRYPYQSLFSTWSLADEKATLTALKAVDIVDLSRAFIHELSGGQRQRVFLAMILAQETPIILLDEPTTYLDINHQVELLNLCQKLHQKGKILALILHDIHLAARYATKLIVMKEGKIYAQGNPKTIINEKMIKDVFGLSCRIISDPQTDTPILLI